MHLSFRPLGTLNKYNEYNTIRMIIVVPGMQAQEIIFFFRYIKQQVYMAKIILKNSLTLPLWLYGLNNFVYK